MPQLIRNRSLVDDRYVLVREAASLADLPDGVPVIVRCRSGSTGVAR
jgi:hypothetical protein